jgi:hypothetical protein
MKSSFSSTAQFLLGFVGSGLLQVAGGSWLRDTFSIFQASDPIFPVEPCTAVCLITFGAIVAGLLLLPRKRALGFGLLASPLAALFILFLDAWYARTVAGL